MDPARPDLSRADLARGEGEPEEPRWPQAGERRIVFLLDAASTLERKLLEQWIERRRPAERASGDWDLISLPRSRRRSRRDRKIDSRLEAALASGGDPLMAPLRVAWLPPLRNGERTVVVSDLLFGDPRDPNRLRQSWIRRFARNRCRIVAGRPAPASELRRRWVEAGGGELTTGLPDFVALQAGLSLERAERQLRGARYKVPRLVHQEILSRPAFRGGLAAAARQAGSDFPQAYRRASSYLREIAATHSPFVIDLVAYLIGLLYRQGYGESLLYDREQLKGIYGIAQRHPVVFLPSHKSNLDHLVLQYALHENGLPPNHTAGGINMNFLPVGPLVRRSGVFFIRRSFKDNEVYKHVLRSYIDYLIEKRFSIEWYMEGGRSRSGKLLPPRFGLLAYVVDAFRRARSEDVFLIPVSIAYDQIQDVSSYTAEQRGGAKKKEGFGWFVGFVRGLRRRHGDIHIRFGEPVSLLGMLGPPDPEAEPDPDESNLSLQKLAFEVSVRINRATPITPTSLVTLALLGVGDRAVTVRETREALANLSHYAQERKLPTTSELHHLETEEGVRRALEALVENGVVTRHPDGPDTVYVIGPDQQLSAAYYRNTIVHFFLNAAISELALLSLDDSENPVETFYEQALRLRDLLKFEFFFSEKDIFRDELRDEMAFQASDWESTLRRGQPAALVQRFRPFSSHRVLRPFLESYRVVAEALLLDDASAEFDAGRFLQKCLGLGKQYLLQRRIRSAASVSKVLFQTALRLAENREALSGHAPEILLERREDFAREIRDTLRRVDAIDALAASRRAGLIP